jgi:spore coat polysaccharide biosynthesis protein SpsF
MNTLLITQARMGSSRLPGKVLKPLPNGESLLTCHLRRAQQARLVNHTLLATTVEPTDDALNTEAQRLGVEVFRGSEQDVLDRFYQAAKPHNPSWVVRLTSDCPLIDATLIDAVVAFAQAHDLDYATNAQPATYPNGFDVEVCRFRALERAWHEATLPSEREHALPYIWKNSPLHGGAMFRAASLLNPFPHEGHLRVTIDNAEDYDLVCHLVHTLGAHATWRQYTKHLLAHPELVALNAHLNRNAGYAKSVAADAV